MTRRNRTWTAIFVAGVCGLATACGSKGDGSGAIMGNAGSGGGGGSSAAGSSGAAGAAGSSGGMCINEGMDNPDCPPVPPFKGECSGRGVCCHRASNSVKEKALGPDDPLILEYRFNYSGTINHPTTIGTDLVSTLTTQVYDLEQQSNLLRIVLPRKGGKEVAGMGKYTFNVGRYNCDGTYSYYSNTAAPPVTGTSTDATRWAPHELDITVDPTKNGIDRVTIPFAKDHNRNTDYTPYVDLNTYKYDWELLNQGFRLVKLDLTSAGRDCQGARNGSSWVAGARFEIYTPLLGNNKQIISSIMQNYCQLVAFGILPLDANGKKPALDCLTEPRCMPGSGTCVWKKLPDSLCPTSDADKALYGCHLGGAGNVNGEKDYPTDLHCTPTAPTTAQDPGQGVTTVGQCCDPLGKSTTLPACNAYRVINDVVAASAEITDQPKNELQPKCIQ